MFCYVNCNLCGNDNTTPLEQGNSPYQVVKCKECGLIYLNPQPLIQLLYQHYDEAYYRPWIEEQAKERHRLWDRRLRQIERCKSKGRLLDVGCGEGTFIHLAQLKRWEVWGTEVSVWACKHIKDKWGIDVKRGELIDVSLPNDYFDAITLWHVLEHTKDPLGNLIKAKKVLKPDGILVIAVPNVRNYIYKTAYMLIKLKRLQLFSLNEREIHLYHFSANTLRKMIEKAGFVLIKFDVDKERVALGKRIIDTCAWVIYKISGVNFGMAIEIYAKKP